MRRVLGPIVCLVVLLVAVAVAHSQNCTGSIFDDHIVGTNDSDRIDGGLGNDYLEGLAGDDTIDCRNTFLGSSSPSIQV